MKACAVLLFLFLSVFAQDTLTFRPILGLGYDADGRISKAELKQFMALDDNSMQFYESGQNLLRGSKILSILGGAMFGWNVSLAVREEEPSSAFRAIRSSIMTGNILLRYMGGRQMKRGIEIYNSNNSSVEPAPNSIRYINKEVRFTWNF